MHTEEANMFEFIGYLNEETQDRQKFLDEFEIRLDQTVHFGVICP